MLRIGRYEVEGEIGRGAMGVVYLARDPQLDRRVAVKVYSLPQGLAQEKQAEFRERFQREARAAASLTHPGIVTVYDAGEDAASGTPYIAMEHVPGRTLAEALADRAAFDLDRVAQIADGLCDALQAAHEAGIVHRDIKPANIMVRDSDGALKIMDFGVARLTSSTLTRSGIAMGSPAFMSPEQVRGQTIDGRSDLFSLGVILYELLCGQRPFPGEDPATVIYSVMRDTPVPVTRLEPALPATLDSFFDRALAKDPGARFDDARQMAAAFAEARRGTVDGELGRPEPAAATLVDASAPAESPHPPGWKRWALAAAAAVALLAGGWMFLGRDAHLLVNGRNSFRSGQLSLLVDGEEVLRRDLAAPIKAGLIKRITGSQHENFEAWIDVNPGVREVVAVVQPDENTEYRDSVMLDLEPGETRKLKLVAGRKFGSTLSLKID